MELGDNALTSAKIAAAYLDWVYKAAAFSRFRAAKDALLQTRSSPRRHGSSGCGCKDPEIRFPVFPTLVPYLEPNQLGQLTSDRSMAIQTSCMGYQAWCLMDCSFPTIELLEIPLPSGIASQHGNKNALSQQFGESYELMCLLQENHKGNEYAFDMRQSALFRIAEQTKRKFIIHLSWSPVVSSMAFGNVGMENLVDKMQRNLGLEFRSKRWVPLGVGQSIELETWAGDSWDCF